MRGGGEDSAHITVNGGSISRLTLGGSLIGGTLDRSGFIEVLGNIGPIRIGGDILGGSVSTPDNLFATGSIKGERIASLFVGGSIRSGTETGGGTLFDSGSVRSENDIGPITIKGSLIGNIDSAVLITGRGQTSPTATTDIAIKSLTVGGRVEFASILAGYSTADLPLGVNADAQIGRVVVGGDWIASNLVAGVQDNTDPDLDSRFGDGDDQKITGGTDTSVVSRIASVLIKGTALGTVGGFDHFGFVAQRIGSFKVGTTAFPLRFGAGNDLPPDDFAVGATGDLRVREVTAP
jgi:hypothetical protein